MPWGWAISAERPAMTRWRRALRLAVALLVLAVAPLAAQQDTATVLGVVLDGVNRHPLPGAVVRLLPLNRQEVTHGNGEFHFPRVPHGRYTVLVERLGYRREVREIDVQRGPPVRLRIELLVSAIELPGLVVTGTVGTRLGEQAVRPVEVVAGQELARKLGTTVAATLAREPGLAAASMGPATAQPVIRGLSGDRVLVLEDGARTGDLASASADHALAIDPLNAQRLEVVRGPAALLYGSNALGGVVNVIRDQVPSVAPDRPTGSVTLQGESVNRGFAAGATGSLGVGPLALRAEGSFRDARSLDTPAGTLENTSLRTWNGALGVGTAGGWGSAGVSARLFDSEYGVPPEEAEGGEEHGHEEVRVAMRRYAVQGRADLHAHAGPYTNFAVNALFTDYRHQERGHEGEEGTEYGLVTAALDLVARHERASAFSSGALGARFDWQDYTAGGSTETPPAREFGLAAFVLEELDVGSLRLQGGARYDLRRVVPGYVDYEAPIGAIRTRTFASVSGSLGAIYALGPRVQLGASVARAFRTPGIAELFSRGPHLASYSFEVGNPDLGAETGLGLEAFLRVRHARLQGEVAVFRNRIDDYIYYRNTGRPGPLELPLYQATASDALLTGAEASAEWLLLRHLVLDGVVSWVRGEYRGDEGDRPLPMMPPLHGQLNLRYEQPAWFVGVGWEGAARQDRVQAPETSTSGYGLLNGTAGVRFNVWDRVHSLTLQADNLTDALYFDHLSRTKDFFPEPGRNLGLVYRVIF